MAAEPTDGSNKFANDGSFMEMFRKRMEAQQKAKTDKERSPSKQEDERTFVRSDSDDVKDSETDKKPQENKPYKGITGKRKALMRTVELREKRKRRREELEEKEEEDGDGNNKSSAWKAYMNEVKAYEARSCSDSDGHKRPLVK